MILLEAHFLELANVRPQEAENRMRGRTPNERGGHDQESAQGARWRVRHLPVPIIFGHRRGLRYRYERIADRTRLFTRILIRLLGVGDLIATAYVLTVEDPHRFRKRRDARMFCGVAAGAEELGESEPQMHISKEGDEYLRALLVQGAHYILGPFGEDSDLRRWGLKLSA